MRPRHISKNCPSQSRCRLCSKSHNTLLHVDNPPQSAYTRHKESSKNQATHVTSGTCNDQILLQTAFVDVLDRQGRPIKCRALLDSVSQINLNTNSCRSKLGLKLEGSNAQFSVAGTAQMFSMGTSNVTLQVKDLQMKIPATVVKEKLTLPLPAVKFERPFGLPKVKLADPNFNQPVEIDMIIGAQLYESLRTGKLIKHRGLHLVCTVFGYVISGVVKQCKRIQSLPIVHHVQLEDTLRRFWEIEKASPPKEKFWTYEEAEATKQYDSITRRDDEPTPILGES